MPLSGLHEFLLTRRLQPVAGLVPGARHHGRCASTCCRGQAHPAPHAIVALPMDEYEVSSTSNSSVAVGRTATAPAITLAVTFDPLGGSECRQKIHVRGARSSPSAGRNLGHAD
eukprot:7267817-Prymnesium_polylepis.1